MKKVPTIFLQAAVALIGIGVLVFMLWEPRIEGRNAHSTVFETYFRDPFLACAYVASILFFVALCQAFRLLGCIRRNEAFSRRAIMALRIIRYCADAIVVFIAGAEAYLFIVRPGDDIAGGVAMGAFIAFASVVVVATAAVSEKVLQDGADMKSQKDLTA